jgi:hypothetical protein
MYSLYRHSTRPPRGEGLNAPRAAHLPDRSDDRHQRKVRREEVWRGF